MFVSDVETSYKTYEIKASLPEFQRAIIMVPYTTRKRRKSIYNM